MERKSTRWKIRVFDVENAPEKVKSFHDKHPAAPRPIALRQFEFKRYENHTTPRVSRKLFGWEDGKFEKEYLEKLERNWRIWKGARHQAYSL
ncbi:hypothetical protein AMATHDRAFT_5900 [Amanita thiersii Skay4041]|uniref:Uncharacterized protein n=1 Tax=Amanita thiersii Skay4041 TaxID=703135 RepID=A0A2A9NCH7_9AGAR|nr:hypothetical protein AMATHDRAFT_5900 [Amanita thiersii Skay4041]